MCGGYSVDEGHAGTKQCTGVCWGESWEEPLCFRKRQFVCVGVCVLIFLFRHFYTLCHGIFLLFLMAKKYTYIYSTVKYIHTSITNLSIFC